MNDAQIIRELREEIEILREQIRQYQADMVQPNAALKSILSHQQSALLMGIYNRDVASYACLDHITSLTGTFFRQNGPEYEKLRTKIAVLKLRAKLKPHGIEIATWRGIGYYMTDANKEKLRKLMEKKDD